MPIKAVLFDLDGTLLDTAPDFSLALNKLLADYGYPPVSAASIRETVSDGARALIKLGFGIEETDPEFIHYLQSLLDLYEDQIGNTRTIIFDGIPALLENLHSLGLPWGIVTNKPSRFTLPLLAKFPLLNPCRVTICADHLKHRKPDPEGLLNACGSLACDYGEVIYVGDHLRDIEAGRNARMPTIAAAWGYFPAGTDLSLWKADLIAAAPEDIHRWLLTENTGKGNV